MSRIVSTHEKAELPHRPIRDAFSLASPYFVLVDALDAQRGGLGPGSVLEIALPRQKGGTSAMRRRSKYSSLNVFSREGRARFECCHASAATVSMSFRVLRRGTREIRTE